MEEKLTKELAKKLIEFKGEIRGIDIISDGDFVLRNHGEEALKKVEEKLKEVGFPIEYKKLKPMGFYPGGLKALSLLAIKEALGYSDEKIEEIGMAAPRFSLIIKLFVKYFFSLKKFFFDYSPKIWREYWTTGEFVPVELNEEKQFATVRYQNFDLHPIYCLYLKGYFTTLTKLITGAKKVECKETKCTFRGDKFHEYFLKWE
jgi:hypothetical protein